MPPSAAGAVGKAQAQLVDVAAIAANQRITTSSSASIDAGAASASKREQH